MVKGIHQSNQRRKIAILGWYGDYNVGNDAILSGVIASLKSVMPDNDFITFSWHPKQTAKQNGVKAYRYHKVLQILPKVDALMVGGGTLLTDWQMALPLFIFMASAVIWVKMLGKPVMLYSIGAEPFSTRIGRFLAKTIVKRADLVTVRGYKSKKALKMLGVSKPVDVMVDPSLILPPLDDGKTEEILKREGVNEAKSFRAVVCLRRVRGIGKRESVKFKRFVAEACDYLAESLGAEVIFLPMSTSVYDDDRKIEAEIMGMMKKDNNGRVKLITGRLAPQEVMAIIACSHLVVSMRLHAIVFAAITHRPMIALTGRISPFVPPSNNKILEFLGRIDRKSWVFDYENASTNSLLAKIEEATVAGKRGGWLAPDLEALKELCVYNAKLAKASIPQLAE